MDEFLPEPIKNFIDTIFRPPKEILQSVINYLNEVSLIAGRGIDLSLYLGFVSYLPSSFQAVVNSLLAAAILLAMLQIIKVIMSLYFNVKEGLKWW